MAASIKDAGATAIVSAAGVATWACLAEWGWPLVSNVRVTAALVLVAGVAACAVGARDAQVVGKARWYQVMGPVGGGASSLAALVALITGWAPALAVSTILMVALWLASTVRHVGTRESLPAAA